MFTGKEILILYKVFSALIILYMFYILAKQAVLSILCKGRAPGKITLLSIKYTPLWTTYRLKVLFETKTGTYEGFDAWDTRHHQFHEGDPVNVRYDPNKPGRFFVEENKRARLGLIVLSLLLAVMLVMYALVA